MDIDNLYLEKLASIVEGREKELSLNQEQNSEKRFEFYFELFTIIIFHLRGGREANALGKKVGSLKNAVKMLFYTSIRPTVDSYQLSSGETERLYALFAEFVAAQMVKRYRQD